MSETLFAATSPGLEPALAEECRAFGWSAREEPGGVELEGASGLHQEANLRLRCANRVLLRVATVGLGELKRVPLDQFWDGRSPVRVSASVHRARITERALREAALEAWDARGRTGAGADAGTYAGAGLSASPGADAGAGLSASPGSGNGKGAGGSAGGGGPEIFLRLDGERLTVSIDTSGELLYRRGYRQEVSRAPLRETIAAAMLRYAGYDGSGPLWDPMCGSGTIPIESALIASRRAPGLQRDFAFERFPSFDPAASKALRERLAAEARRPEFEIRGGDLNAGSLGTARRNARRAGVLEALTLERQDATKPTKVPKGTGWIVSNLPYGIRVGERGAIEQLYRAFGEALRTHARGWRFALLVAGSETALGLPIARRQAIDNGGIRCTLLLGEAR